MGTVLIRSLMDGEKSSILEKNPFYLLTITDKRSFYARSGLEA